MAPAKMRLLGLRIHNLIRRIDHEIDIYETLNRSPSILFLYSVVKESGYQATFINIASPRLENLLNFL